MPVNTAFSPNPDYIAQITGSGTALPGLPTQLGSGMIPTYAATIDLGPCIHFSRWLNIVTNSTVGNATLTCTVVRRKGSYLWLQVDNDAGGARTITFSTGFRVTAATLVGTASKIMTICFVSDGTTYNEVSRTVAMT